MKKNLLIIGAGHGGKDRYGHYTTAPKKQFRHKEEDITPYMKPFIANGFFCEGLFNRAIQKRIGEIYTQWGHAWNFDVKVVSEHIRDTPLRERTDLANNKSAGYERSILISLHANASNGKGHGFEVWHYPGSTKGIALAKILEEEWMESQYALRNRGLKSDYEALGYSEPFWMLRKTYMPSILVEWGFFDNPGDTQKMCHPMAVTSKAWTTLRTAQRYFNEV